MTSIPNMLPFRLLGEAEIRELVRMPDALEAVRGAYAALARGEVEQPPVIALELRDRGAEVHAKGAYLRGKKHFTLKVVGGFPENARLGRSTTSGSVFAFSAETGDLVAILLDNGFLTELRTAAAGALAADLLARSDAKTVGVIGTGNQARYQVEALLLVRRPIDLIVWGRTPSKVQAYAREIETRHRIPVRIADSADQVVRNADILITTTAAREALVDADSVRPGTHVTAIGSDMPGKQELDPRLIARATVVVDRYEQCAVQGELQHALASGLIEGRAGVHAEIGDIVIGRKSGRTNSDQITVADFTGVGALDAAMAELVLARVAEVEGASR